MKIIVFFLCTFFSLNAEIIDIISDFYKYEPGYFPIEYKILKNLGFEIKGYNLRHYENLLTSNEPQARKIFVWNHILNDTSPILKLPKEKLIFFLWEPWKVDLEYYLNYSKIYTWDDSLIDNKLFFKFYYPYLMPMREVIPSFEKKKFCCMVASNMTNQRINIIDFFETKPLSDFEFFGFKNYNSKNYCGPIQGPHSGEEKIALLSKYRFCICFENSINFAGYITEKIFCCFAAGCIPIYWGATNIEQYIPKNCFIDYRDFTNNEELYQYLQLISQQDYEEYLNNIRCFLISEDAKIFSPENFDKIFANSIFYP